MGRSALPGRRLRILVVERHPDMRLGLEVFLQSLGHWPQLVETMTRAVALAVSCETFDLLLSDICLADGDGWDLPGLLERAGHRPLHAIAMTCVASLGDAEKSRASGFRSCLVKPGAPGELEAALNAVAAL